MAHFARVINNIVQEVIVADQTSIDSGEFGDPNQWIQTSYNTRGGVHVGGGTPLRKNYAGQGFTYDPVLDAFIPPQPFPSWTLNTQTCLWVSPKPYPDDPDHMYKWNEFLQEWELA